MWSGHTSPRPSARSCSVDAHAADSFYATFAEVSGHDFAEVLAIGGATKTLARHPAWIPAAAYPRRLRWYAATGLCWTLVELGAGPADDPTIRAAFLLASDHAVILLRNQFAAAIGGEPLTPAGLERWARSFTTVDTGGLRRPEESLV